MLQHALSKKKKKQCYILQPYGPSFVEAFAIVWALHWARDEKFQSIIVKGDSKIHVMS